MIGHDDLVRTFKSLHKEGSLSHSYIFFGEPQVGKRKFAVQLANYLEKGKFEQPDGVLMEFMEIRPKTDGTSESIGIDEIRDIKNFLYQKPVSSSHRVAVVDSAELMTDQAQNAVLKIAEEPPEHALLILVVSNPEALIKTLQSRFQRIYFPRMNSSLIDKMLCEDRGLSKKEAELISRASFGRPGRAIDLIDNSNLKEIKVKAQMFLAKRIPMKDILSELADIENKNKIRPFLTELIAELMAEPEKNFNLLKSVLNRQRMLEEWNVNRKIQLESALTSFYKK